MRLKYGRHFYFMEKEIWYPVFYNGLETNVEVTKCGRVKKVKVDWMKYKTAIGEIDFTKLKLVKDYQSLGIQIKGLKQKKVLVHQLIASAFLDYKWNYMKNVVDHIDSNTLNNNVDNLQVVSHRENCSREKTIKSGLPTGVYFWKKTNKYYSNIYINGKSIFLGYFETIEKASEVYQNKLITLNK